MNEHTCHARCCPEIVPPSRLMCLHHWRRVPRELQRAVWANYREGQEAGRADITTKYLVAAEAAIDAVHKKEVAEGKHAKCPRCGRARAKQDEQLELGAGRPR